LFGVPLWLRHGVKDLNDVHHYHKGDRAKVQQCLKKAFAEGKPLEISVRSLEQTSDGPILTRLSGVTSEPVDWFWKDRLARGKLTVLMGEPGLGKSFLTLYIASRVTTGRPWPDGGRPP
jgi:predicted ATP-dependent serine protease